ncbi:MAG: DinB family protein [Tepidiformaceae bacterium]
MNPRAQLVIDEMARHRTQFDHLCVSLSPGELAAEVPGSHWTVKDYVAHLCTIDGLIVAGFGPMVGLQMPAPATPMPQPFDIDEWNDAAVLPARGRSLDDLMTERAMHREQMVELIGAMTDQHLDVVIPYGGDRKSLNLPKSMVRFGGLLWGIAIHDPTHTRDILEAIPHRKSEPWITEWLDSVSDAQVPQGVREQRV